ncbi:MAG: AAA family ATPase [Bacilli bacterium]|nr:AAA family ATPase [Bacilli bacterium]
MKAEREFEFKRKIYDDLLSWAKSGKKEDALLIEGPRRVGKTTIVKKLAREAYRDFLYLDFKIASDAIKELFTSDHMADLDSFFRNLFLLCGKTPRPGSLIIFDEVQYCLQAREDIKYLVADGRYDYIETGSLITILSNEANIQIPSEETILYMHPMDFQEYLWAKGEEDPLPVLRDLVESNQNIPDAVHQKLMGQFREYMAVGGMPQSVAALLKKNSYLEVEKAKKRILSLYCEDLRKYDSKNGTFCEALFKDIPSQLAAERESYRFLPSLENVDSRSVKIEQSIRALNDFKMTEIVYRSPDLTSFLESGKDLAFYKFYYMDVGLLFTSLASLSEGKINFVYAKFLKGEGGINLGGIMESVVCQMLSARHIQKYYHVFTYREQGEAKERRYEIDFVFKYGLANILMEVKSTSRYKTSSLDAFHLRYPDIKGHRFVVGIKNFRKEQTQTTLPLYLLPIVDFRR